MLASMVINTHVVQGKTAHIIGQGTQSCGTWTAARAAQAAFTHEQWVLGYLSGVGFAVVDRGIDPLVNVDADGVWGWIDNYCQGHPLSPIVAAASAFVAAH